MPDTIILTNVEDSFVYLEGTCTRFGDKGGFYAKFFLTDEDITNLRHLSFDYLQIRPQDDNILHLLELFMGRCHVTIEGFTYVCSPVRSVINVPILGSPTLYFMVHESRNIYDS